MVAADLEARRGKLDERLRKMRSVPLIAVRLDLLKNLINDLEADPELKRIFGEPVLRHLALVWDKANDDVLVADANVEEIDDGSKIRFLKILRELIDRDLGE
jgi:hypothetical protein